MCEICDKINDDIRAQSRNKAATSTLTEDIEGWLKEQYEIYPDFDCDEESLRDIAKLHEIVRCKDCILEPDCEDTPGPEHYCALGRKAHHDSVSIQRRQAPILRPNAWLHQRG